LSRGVEESASFASLGARQTLRAAAYYRQVLACELVAAVRALRLRRREPEPGLPLAAAYALAAEALDPRMADRPLTDDVAVAAGLLDELARVGGVGGVGLVEAVGWGRGYLPSGCRYRRLALRAGRTARGGT